jgi:CubicO group peptidase (beta-lactamase class C family)
VTSVDDPLPVDDRTLFMIGSTSKTFTATALMRLVDDGRVSLDDPVVRHLPDFRLKDRAATRALTLRHLVTHTGGWDGDIDTDTGWGDDALARYVEALSAQPQLLPVGTTWSYNNAGFCVAGRVIEKVTQSSFEAAVTDLVLTPLGMSDSFYSPVAAATRRFAVGHVSGPRRPSVAHTWGLSRAMAAAGGLLSTVRDQLVWARFHLGDLPGAAGRRVLRARTRRLMQSDLEPAGNLADAVGVSWLIKDIGGVRTVAHGGNVSNIQLSTFLMVPSHDMAVTVLTNATDGRRVADEVERWALERFVGVREELPPLLRPAPDLSEYVGAYSSRLSKVEVASQNRHLLLTSRYNVDEQELSDEEKAIVRRLVSARARPQRLGVFAPDRAVVLSGPSRGLRVEFLRSDNGGGVAWLRSGGRLHRRLR